MGPTVGLQPLVIALKNLRVRVFGAQDLARRGRRLVHERLGVGQVALRAVHRCKVVDRRQRIRVFIAQLLATRGETLLIQLLSGGHVAHGALARGEIVDRGERFGVPVPLRAAALGPRLRPQRARLRQLVELAQQQSKVVQQ